MEILVPDQIKKKELDGEISEVIRKVMEKLKDAPEAAQPITAPKLPANTVLRKVYATTGQGPRRLLLFFKPHPRPAQPPDRKAAPLPPEPWVLLLCRTKHDSVGKNMSHKNEAFLEALAKRMKEATDDLAGSTADVRRYTVI